MAAFACLFAWTSASLAQAPADGMANPVRMGPDGYFRLPDGTLYLPLGGLHGNMAPLAMLKLTDSQREELSKKRWRQYGMEFLDVLDVPDEALDDYFRQLAELGVNCQRLFPRYRVEEGVLDIVGRMDERMAGGFRRVFDAGERRGIRFLFQVMPAPNRTGYLTERRLKRQMLPRYTKEQLARLADCRKPFLLEGKTLTLDTFFTDPNVLACQKMYLREALDWRAKSPAVFAMEIYNEQGDGGVNVKGRWQRALWYHLQEQEIAWSGEIVRTIHERMPKMPVCLSHSGHGVILHDPLKWVVGAGVDFYSSHLYAGLCGESDKIDFAAVTGATTVILRESMMTFPGEWGVLAYRHPSPEDVRRRAYRDGIWLSLMARGPGFLQWDHNFMDEYRWPAKVFAALPRGFSPAPPPTIVAIGKEYRTFQTNSRYEGYTTTQPTTWFPIIGRKAADENLARIYAAYVRSLEIGVPIRFLMGSLKQAVTLERFLELEPGSFSRPIRADGGYQLAYLKDANSPTWVGYLRSRKVERFAPPRRGEPHILGVPVKRPLRLAVDLPEGEYTLTLINMVAGRVTRSKLAARDSVEVAEETDDDFVFVITPADAEFKLN